MLNRSLKSSVTRGEERVQYPDNKRSQRLYNSTKPGLKRRSPGSTLPRTYGTYIYVYMPRTYGKPTSTDRLITACMRLMELAAHEGDTVPSTDQRSYMLPYIYNSKHSMTKMDTP